MFLLPTLLLLLRLLPLNFLLLILSLFFSFTISCSFLVLFNLRASWFFISSSLYCFITPFFSFGPLHSTFSPLSYFYSLNFRASSFSYSPDSFSFVLFYLSLYTSISHFLSAHYLSSMSTQPSDLHLLHITFLPHHFLFILFFFSTIWFSFLFLVWHPYIHIISLWDSESCFRVPRNYVLSHTAVHFGPQFQMGKN
jgi:hypothetical protein